MTNTELLFGLPIELTHGLGTIYQPKLKDFFIYPYNNFVRSFNMRKEYIYEDDKIPENIENFDIFFLFLALVNDNPTLAEYIKDLLKSLCLLYKCENDEVRIKEDTTKKGLERFYIEIQKKYILDRHNYDYLCVTIMNMLNNEIQVKENGEMSEIEKKIAKARAKFEKEHKKEKKEEGYNIFDLANYIIHADNSIYNYETIQELTIYQIKNTYKLYQLKESYNLFMDYKTSGNFDIKEDRPHWFFNKN